MSQFCVSIPGMGYNSCGNVDVSQQTNPYGVVGKVTGVVGSDGQDAYGSKGVRNVRTPTVPVSIWILIALGVGVYVVLK